MQIKISKGLDIPVEGRITKNCKVSSQSLTAPQEIALSLHPFHRTKFKLHVKAGDQVKKGQPILHDKGCEQRVFVAPAAGKIKEVRRGLKRRLLDIVIEVDQNEENHDFGRLDITKATRDQLIARLCEGGLFAHIRHRPLNTLAKPDQTPRSIFVNCAASAPFAVPPELQVDGNETDFQTGLDTLAKLTDGDVNLVYNEGSTCKAFTNAQGIEHHTVSGPHPSGNTSVHIYNIDPIKHVEDVVWTVGVVDVIAIGHLMNTGRYYTDRVIAVGGPALMADKRGYFKGRMGHPVGGLIAGRNEKGLLRMISGDVLTGQKVEVEDFLGFYDTAFTVVAENVTREMLHFFRLGVDKYTASGTYASGKLGGDREYSFTTNQHGEHRGIVDGEYYQSVIPMRIPLLPLVRAIQGKDLDLAEQLGMLEVVPEDLALATFVCPSKNEFGQILWDAQNKHAEECLG